MMMIVMIITVKGVSNNRYFCSQAAVLGSQGLWRVWVHDEQSVSFVESAAVSALAYDATVCAGGQDTCKTFPATNAGVFLGRHHVDFMRRDAMSILRCCSGKVLSEKMVNFL